MSRPRVGGRVGCGIRGSGGGLQPISEFGRVYATYGSVFIALSVAWGAPVDGFRPDRYDILGALICVAGVLVMAARPGAQGLSFGSCR